MGCDIHPRAQVLTSSGVWEDVGEVFPLSEWDQEWSGREFSSEPFGWRNYGMFGFLANVRNYSHVPFVAERRGVPQDMRDAYQPESRHDSAEWEGYHSHSWLLLKELLDFDYDQVFWDRRVTKNGNGAALAEEGEGEHRTVREFLGKPFFEHLEVLKSLGEPESVRIVFWFDS